MENFIGGKIAKAGNRHAPEVSQQTGFPSAATHYQEAPIDLHKELIYNQDATFFVRIVGENWVDFNIYHHDVLIIDRSFKLQKNRLALIVKEGEFDIINFNTNYKKEEIQVWGIITFIIHNML
ncbi:S24 family peptidase [Zunongwangia sp.]|uniref:S24 family peptidase n=1 Tax=Zunongwangia sp. TaxID=1965325 RepID=UPI003AA8BCBD